MCFCINTHKAVLQGFKSLVSMIAQQPLSGSDSPGSQAKIKRAFPRHRFNWTIPGVGAELFCRQSMHSYHSAMAESNVTTCSWQNETKQGRTLIRRWQRHPQRHRWDLKLVSYAIALFFERKWKEQAKIFSPLQHCPRHKAFCQMFILSSHSWTFKTSTVLQTVLLALLKLKCSAMMWYSPLLCKLCILRHCCFVDSPLSPPFSGKSIFPRQ